MARHKGFPNLRWEGALLVRRTCSSWPTTKRTPTRTACHHHHSKKGTSLLTWRRSPRIFKRKHGYKKNLQTQTWLQKKAVKVKESLYVKEAKYCLVPWKKLKGKLGKKHRKIPVNIDIPPCRFDVCNCKGNMLKAVLDSDEENCPQTVCRCERQDGPAISVRPEVPFTRKEDPSAIG